MSACPQLAKGAGLALTLHLAVVASGCASLRPAPLGPEAQPFFATTDDGWRLSLVRYPAQAPATGRPVLLCHGIAANDRNMNLDERHSLAQWLAAHGREAWTMSLRGTGGSDRADAAAGRPADTTFDDFWRYDLPAAIAQVQQISGAAEIDYIGHSMGGLVLYAYLAQGGAGIAAAATMGSPTRLDFGSQTQALLRFASSAVPATGAVPTAGGAWLLAPFQGLADDDRLQRLFYNPANVSAASWSRLMASGTADVAAGVARQLSRLSERGTFSSADGAIDFRAGLAKVRVPVLVVAGRIDRVAPVPAVKDGYRALGGPKEWLLISRAHGQQAEYNHMDLVIGERAGDEVWAPILRFLERHR